MKKLIFGSFLAIVALLSSSVSFAQPSFGPEIGFTASGLQSDDEETLAGINFQVGVTAHYQIGDFFAVRPSILFKAGSLKHPDIDDLKVNLTRISIPIPLLFSKRYENKNMLFAGAGPNLMLNLSGKYEIGSENEDISFGSDEEDDLKRFDLGLHIRGGFQFSNGLAISLFSNFGLSNLSTISDTKIKTIDAIGLSIGYMIGGK